MMKDIGNKYQNKCKYPDESLKIKTKCQLLTGIGIKFIEVIKIKMRLWHKDLIKVLPRQQLLSQWRECCCIAKNIATNGTPNHLLVNKILDYPLEHFVVYSNLVINEMGNRGYKISENAKQSFCINLEICKRKGYFTNQDLTQKDIYANWHNSRYMVQCLCNLQEKYDCGGISQKEWESIVLELYAYFWVHRIDDL